MFGSAIVSKALYERLTALPEAASYAGRIVGLPVLPQAVPLPGVAYYPEFSSYSAPIGGPLDVEKMRFAIKAMCEDTSTAPIIAFANAQLDYFQQGLGKFFDYIYEGVTYQITFDANGEVLPTTVVDGSTFYRQLGTVYDVEIIRGG